MITHILFHKKWTSCTDDIFKTRLRVDDERSKNAVEIEFLMRSNISKSSLLMRLLNRDKRQTRRFHENYTTLIENFACGAHVMIAFVNYWG